MRAYLYILTFVLSLIFSTSTFADGSPNLTPRCNQTVFDLCGFIDAKIWNEHRREVFIIEPKYERAEAFSDGLAAVRIEGKYGYINSSNELIITPQFDRAGEFDQGFAVSGTNNALGIIDQSGNYVVDPIFSHAKVFSDEIILGISTENAEQGYSSHGKYNIFGAGLYNISDGWLTEQKYNFERFGDPNKGLIWAQDQTGETGTWDDEYGLMQIDGSWLIEPQFRLVSELRYNRAPIRKMIDGQTIAGAIDEDGRQVIPFKFESLSHMDENFLLAHKGRYPDQKEGIVSFDGKLLGGRYFDDLERPDRVIGPDHPKHDFYMVKDGDEWKTLTKDGVLLSDQRVGQIFLKCDQFSIFYDTNGYALVPKDNKLPTVRFESPLFSSSDQTCTPPPTLTRGKSYATTLKNGKVFAGFYENSKGFFGTHKWVSVNDKWGLVSVDGDFSIKPIYTSVSREGPLRLQASPLVVETDETYKVIRDSEAFRLSFVDGKYVEVSFTKFEENTTQILNCDGPYRRKSKDGLWGIVDETGKPLIPMQYRAITCFSNGVAWVPDDTQRQWCPIDRHNRIRSAPACSTTRYAYWASHSDPQEFDEDPYESSVLWMRAHLDYGEGRRDEKPGFVPW